MPWEPCDTINCGCKNFSHRLGGTVEEWVCSNDPTELKKRLDGPNGKKELNEPGYYTPDPPLQKAWTKKHLKCAQLLLDAGATYVLWQAAKAGDAVALKKRLATAEGKSELDQDDLPGTGRGRTPLQWAWGGLDAGRNIQTKHPECAKLLIAAGAKYTVGNAAAVGDATALAARLAKPEGKAELESVEVYGSHVSHTPLGHAAYNGNTDCARLLLKAGAQPGQALTIAASFGRVPITEMLLNHYVVGAKWLGDYNVGEMRVVGDAIRQASQLGHAACAYLISKAIGQDFGKTQLQQVRQLTLQYDLLDQYGFPMKQALLGGEQGDIKDGAQAAVASAPAGPQGRWWGTPTSKPGVADRPEASYNPPLSKLPATYYYQNLLGPRLSQCVVWIQNIDLMYSLDWFGHWCDNNARAVVLGQKLLCFHWSPQGVTATNGAGSPTGPFLTKADEAVKCAKILAKRLNEDPTHTMDGGTVPVKTAEELKTPDGRFFNPLCWGNAQLQEMAFLMKYFPDALVIRSIDTVQPGEGGGR